MEARYDRGCISIELGDLWDKLSYEDKKSILKDVAWEKEILDDIVDAICNEKIVTSNFECNIFDARQRILESLAKLEANHFRSLLLERNEARLNYERMRQDYYKLLDAVRDSIPWQKFSGEGYQSARWPSDGEVQEEIEKRRGQ